MTRSSSAGTSASASKPVRTLMTTIMTTRSEPPASALIAIATHSRGGEEHGGQTISALDAAIQATVAGLEEGARYRAHLRKPLPVDALGEVRFQPDQAYPVAAHGQVRDQRHCQHVAHAHADAETKPQQLEVNAFGMQAAARPGIEQIARNRQQCKRQQAGNEQFELVGTLTQSAEARCRFQYWIDLGNRRVRLSQG
ncbi:hypothetical protein G6F22_016811 [Rhizopus arrhizus]|nr:hypothetical protein G6F22_016811 [Rhizopus arrhizus]